MWSKILLLLVAAAVATADESQRKLYRYQGDEATTFEDPIDGISWRLPNNTRPLNYYVYLVTNIHAGEFGFLGHVEIAITAVEDTDVITVNYRELTIESVRIYDVITNTAMNATFTLEEDREFLHIHPETPLVQGYLYNVIIDYVGILRNDDAGFYRSWYDRNGTRVWLATTQFQATDARHAFPCFDEPGIRATFVVSIQHHNSYHAISNMPLYNVVPVDDEFVISAFERTPPVQTYLIAFLISDFASLEDVDEEGIPHRIFSTPEDIEDGFGDLALNVSRSLLDGFADYLGVNYSLPKMDQAAIPDFAAGAMENWGLVTYAEPYLLFSENSSTTRDRENVIATISHEFVHQWFGNLVSPAWWSFLWMNEGFATLYEYYLTDMVYPGERWADQMLTDTVQPVMETDANPNIRAMTYYVENPNRIEYLFDSVAYSKSGSVLRMFMNSLGVDTWRKGLNYYLNSRAFENATPEQLHAGLQMAANEDSLAPPQVDRYMQSWETQSGFPYINVTRNGNYLEFEQNRFLYTNRSSENVWFIPISYAFASRPNFTNTVADFWLSERTRILGSAVGADEWIIFNIQQTGYYRVNYDTLSWRLITDHLSSENFDEIHVLNRAQLVDDSHHLARAGLLNYDTLMNVMNYLERETDYIPWASSNRANTLINRYLVGSRIYPQYQAFMRKNVEQLFLRLGVFSRENEQRVDRYARTIAINIACQAQHPECLAAAHQRVVNVAEDSEAIEVDLVGTIYCNGLRIANETIFNAFWDLAIGSASQSRRNTILSALGCIQDPDVLYNYLSMAIDPNSTLSANERSRALTSPMNYGEESVRTMIRFVREQWNSLTANQISTMSSNIAARVSNEDLFDDFSLLLDELVENEQLSANSRNNYMNSAQAILDWQAIHLEHIASVLDPSTESTTAETPVETTSAPPTDSTESTTAETPVQTTSLPSTDPTTTVGIPGTASV